MKLWSSAPVPGWAALRSWGLCVAQPWDGAGPGLCVLGRETQAGSSTGAVGPIPAALRPGLARRLAARPEPRSRCLTASSPIKKL